MRKYSVTQLLLILVVPLLLLSAACEYTGTSNAAIWPSGTFAGVADIGKGDSPRVTTAYAQTGGA